MSTASAPRTYDPKKYRIVKVEYDHSTFHYEPQKKILFWWKGIIAGWDWGEPYIAKCGGFEAAKQVILDEIDSQRKPKRTVVHDRHKHS